MALAGIGRFLVGLVAIFGTMSSLAMSQVVAVGEDGMGDCAELEITEIFTNFRNDQSEQFVEFFNPTVEALSLEGCIVRVKYSSKVMVAEFGEILIRPGEHQAYSLQSLGLQIAKSPTAERVIEFLEGENVVNFVALLGLPKSSIGKSFALVDESWVNATPTPSADNLTAPEFATAPDNESSGVEDEGVKNVGIVPDALTPIEHEPGSGADTSADNAKEYADCGEGRYRNPETNRCKKIEEEPEVKPCAEGYERNLETNRCRKIRENSGAVAGFGVPDSGGGEGGGSGASAVSGALATATAAVGDALDVVFRDEDGYLQGWKVVLAAVAGVLVIGVVICYVFRERLGRIAVLAKIYEKIRSIYGKVVEMRAKIAEKY